MSDLTLSLDPQPVCGCLKLCSLGLEVCELVLDNKIPAFPIALDDIEPIHVRQFLNWRVQWTIERNKAENVERVVESKEPLSVLLKVGHVLANREKAWFSHIWNHVRDKGLTKLSNPRAGVKGHRELRRDA